MKKLLFLFVSLIIFSCGGPQTQEAETAQETPSNEAVVENESSSALSWENNGIKVYEANVDVTYPNAKITLDGPMAPQAGSNEFRFSVEEYELGAQTEDAEIRSCANSAKGQHIHFIMNNAPYKAKYEPVFEEEVPEGTNVLLAFLSRSYHESIKTHAAHVLVKYGPGGQDLTEPMLFYSRPKGTYAGQDGKKLLLDFFIRNLELSDSGYKVRATINGKEFILPKWCPYFVEGLPVGENTFRLELIDAEGNVVLNTLDEAGNKTVGIYSDSGERIINITEG